MALPAGFGFPSLPYLVVLLVAVAGAVGLLLSQRPRLTERVALSFVPWMIVGAALHALLQLGTAPDIVEPFLGTPAVYLSTFALAAFVWVLAGRLAPDRVPEALAGVGTAAFLPVLATVLGSGGGLRPWLSVGSVVGAAILAGACWVGLDRVAPRTTAATGGLGLVVVFAHALDGVSTAVGADVLEFTERTPLSRAILDLGAALPTADLIGAGWLFVLVKVGLASVIVYLFADYVREEPTQAYLLLSVVVAVGLGPGAQNVLLFAVR